MSQLKLEDHGYQRRRVILLQLIDWTLWLFTIYGRGGATELLTHEELPTHEEADLRWY